jgi:hypothetical protein
VTESATERHELPHGDPAYITEVARGIVTNELMVADLSNPAWQISLGLMMTSLAGYSNLGLVLVPKSEHINMGWINNTAPGCTVKCQCVATEDIEAVQAECDRMHAALHPTPPTTKDNNMSITLNGHPLDTGIIVDGDIHGQYADDRLAEFAEAHDITLTDDTDSRVWRAKINEAEANDDGMAANYRDSQDEATTRLIELLNEQTEGGSFEWEDGSVFLVSDDDVDSE